MKKEETLQTCGGQILIKKLSGWKLTSRAPWRGF